jgi:hypothetical protein
VKLLERPGIVEIASAASDDDLIGIGGSSYKGDLGRTGVPVPSDPTATQDNRFLIRLCGVYVPTGGAITVRGLRQGVLLRGQRTVGEGEAAVTTTFEREQVSPFWQFPDGNISWHLRWLKTESTAYGCDAAQEPGTSPNTQGTDSALLYLPPFSPYKAPNAGMPLGDPVGSLGTWRDIRFPWENTDWSLEQVLCGPGKVVLYASVHQTNASVRVEANFPALDGMREEDLFLSSFYSTCRYGRVAGAIIYEPVLPGGKDKK